MAKLIPDGASIVEFGAGNSVLGQMLPAGATLVSTDLVASESVLVDDWNARPLPEPPNGDLAFLSGVVEYVNDVGAMTESMARSYNHVLVSYVTADHVATADRDPL